MTEQDIMILEGFEKAARTRDVSYDMFSRSRIRYLKNIGLLDCYFDYDAGQDMIFLTDAGKAYLKIYRDEQRLKDLSDFMESGAPLHGPVFEAALLKAASYDSY